VKKLLAYLHRQHAGLLALFIALSGTSYAVATRPIGSSDIRNNSIMSRDVRNNSLKGSDMRDGSIKSEDLADGRVAGVDIAHATIGAEHVKNGALTDAELGPNSVSSDELRDGSVGGDEVKNGSLGGEELASGVVATNVVVRFDTFTVNMGQAASHSIGCASGERAFGGGVSFATDDPDDRVTYSEPRTGGAQPATQGALANSWRAGIWNGGDATRTASVWVLCGSK
jgi:hypothetical protein